MYNLSSHFLGGDTARLFRKDREMNKEEREKLTAEDLTVLHDNQIWESYAGGMPVFQGFKERFVQTSLGVVECGGRAILDNGFPCEVVGSLTLHIPLPFQGEWDVTTAGEPFRITKIGNMCDRNRTCYTLNPNKGFERHYRGGATHIAVGAAIEREHFKAMALKC